ncbi:TBC1 domain family member 7 [Schistocerca cancellata]|uniref:TBC1 domain family member 7 n=1 Tax=Schistocerca cancellata TaxID=274614 RepID=UPI0021174C7F|nr:TBC1 domain family member 7 [Schistocerca cancellata]
MASDERNFRSSYYEKVGFRSVEEKKSLEILLKDKPLDKMKLRQFCIRFTVPGIYRNLVWKVLLDVIPIHVDSHKFVMEQRKEEYKDLLHALRLMQIVNDRTPKPELFLLMWLLQTGRLTLYQNQLNTAVNRNLCAISHSLSVVFDDDVDIYWLSKGFFESVVKFRDDIPTLIKYTKSVLEKEDEELYCHLQDLGAFNTIPLDNWLCCCFAGVISESSLGKIWDKLIGGSCKILVFVAVLLLVTLKRALLKCATTDNIASCLKNISEEVSEVIVNQAIEMWQQYGSSLNTVISAEGGKTHLTTNRQK